MRGMMVKMMAAAAMTAASPAQAQQVNAEAKAMRELGVIGLRGRQLAAAIEVAKVFPLGSAKSPVRADGPAGERA